MAKAKKKVLARFPEAKPVIAHRWPSGEPRYIIIEAPGVGSLDIHRFDDGGMQGYTAAWRSALYWCHRNPERPA